jgi:fibronectin-binding autotransporter adhesin
MKKIKKTLLSMLALGLASSANAANYYWVGGNGGTWSDGIGGWSDVAAGPDNTIWNNQVVDKAIFDGLGAFTVNLGNDITVGTVQHNNWGSPFNFNLGGNTLTLNSGGNNISYNADDGTFSNGTIALARNSQFKIGNRAGDSSVVVAIDASISGSSFGLTKVGFGTLSLGGSNTFGGTTVNGGTVLVKAGSSLGAGNVTLTGASGNFGVLNLQNGLAIADTATVDLITGSSLNLDFTGIETVAGLTIDGGSSIADGLYTVEQLNTWADSSVFSGTGEIGVNVVPEPNTYALFAGLLTLTAVMVRRHQ